MNISVDRMRNWGRWLRRGYMPRRAQSLEGEFRTNRDLYPSLGERPADPVEADAWDIETACRILPIERHRFLRFMYATPLCATDLCRRMWEDLAVELAVRDIEAYEGQALSLVAEALEFTAEERMDLARRRVHRELLTNR